MRIQKAEAPEVTPTASMRPVLIVLSSNGRRGAELQGAGLADELAALGTETELVSLAPASKGGHLEVEVLGDRPLSVRTLWRLRARARQSSVVIGYGSKTLPACAISMRGIATPFVYRSIGSPSDWVRGDLHRWRTRLLVRTARQVVALWPGAATQLRNLYRIPENRISVIPNARSIAAFPPATSTERHEARLRLGISTETPVVAWIGSLSSEKRPELVPEIAGILPGVTFLMAGDGPMREAVDLLVGLCDGEVHLLGQVADVRSVLAAADLLISTSRTEGMPGTIIEAALMGIPAVATAVGATDVVVKNGDQLTSADPDPQEFSQKIRSALAQAHSLGSQARLRALEHFSWQVVAPQWVQIIEQVRADDER